MIATVYRVRLVIDGADEGVELARTALAAARTAARWARMFPEAQIVMEGVDVGADAEATS